MEKIKKVKIGEKFQVYRRNEERHNNTEHPEPEWTAENMNRRKGDTTFKQCGWCEHASCGSCRYDCYLSTSCSLMSDYGIGEHVFWDTQCMVKHLSASDLKDEVHYHKSEIESCLSQIKDAKKSIAILNKQIKKVGKDSTPPTAENRSAEYFNVGNRIRLFLDGRVDGGIKDGKVGYVTGTVVLGYRHHDGCVSYVLDDYPESKKGWGCGTGVPSVMLEKDYQFFKSHLDKFAIWLELQDRDYNGNRLKLQLMYDTMVDEVEKENKNATTKKRANKTSI